MRQHRQQLQAMSEGPKAHSVESSLGLMQCSRLSPTKRVGSLNASEPTTNPKTLFDGYSADAPLPARRTVQGETKENILGSRKEED
jgi:hypothetical protein